MINKLKSAYKKFDSTTQLRIKQIGVFITVVIILVLSYSNRSSEIKQETAVKNEEQVVDVVTDAQLFEQDISDELDEKLSAKQAVIDKQAEDISQLKELFAIQMQTKQSNESEEKNGSQPSQYFPPMPPEQQNGDYPQNLDPQIPQWVGGIVHEEYETIVKIEDKDNSIQKKRVIKLPPSFMKGFLLTGMDAMTIEGSNDSPEPMMIRVQAPAVLPNEVKANLKGCFVIAEGYGNLATHRVDARLKSLSCIDLAGNSVIFELIKGYVQDSDGKRGIKGVPVHRAGALIARSMIAGAFEGIGNAITGSAQTTNISALGQVNNTPSGNLAKAAIGGGISAGAKDVRSLFLQLARQSSPVIEVGAAKEISVVITELVELKIQEL